MKVLILAGGYGTRLSEETGVRPKPMVSIGGRPVLWHIMKSYAHFGFSDFVILGGYKCEVIKEYFANYWLNTNSVTIDLAENSITSLSNERTEKWRVTILDTGVSTMTGGRIKRAQDFVGNEPFMLTYGDGLADIQIPQLLEEHKKSGKALTMTSVQPSGRFGTLQFDETGEVSGFIEKPDSAGWINGGFFVCEPSVFDFIDEGDRCVFERQPLEKMARERQINCYQHSGFWKCMDTLADKNALEKLWNDQQAAWKIWSDDH